MTQTYRCALITGATSGVGKEIALLLARQVEELILVDGSKSRLEELSKQLSSKVRAKTVVIDFTTKFSLDEVYRMVQEKRPDLVINASGLRICGDELSLSIEEQSNMIAINCRAVFDITYHAVKALKEADLEGVVLNISSFLDRYPTPNLSVYAATKSFVSSFSEALDMEVKPFGIRVLTASPGRVHSGVHKSFFDIEPKKCAIEIVRQIKRRTPYMVIDWRYRLFRALLALFPRRCIACRLGAFLKRHLPK